jgi:hypothetical protein
MDAVPARDVPGVASLLLAFLAVVKPPFGDFSFDTFASFLHFSGNLPQSARSKREQKMRNDMRTLIGAVIATLMFSGAAFAAEAEGQIKKIDIDQLTITLDDGKSYKLPGEFDVSSLKEGMEILLAYDEIGGENLITDMELSE